MGWNRGQELKHCRWCGKVYFACQPVGRSGFCIPAHKQAHYRAYKKWVTGRQISPGKIRDQRVTPKKARKRGEKRVKKTKEKSR